ncbi:discoidin domain-containing protein [Bacillus sp. 3255]|uniref:discoidin domain-containing protein n=1 Tax=Bacillus sp. 3255 TaxID=2817904 RepID=UPI00286280D4|nr:discoidin domain-containing protein [Bacillus sp. 3255]MDR6883109.1 hypothetical protein [Bacillus sp. 3255]
MYRTTQNFKNNIYAPERRTAGRVTFDISDVTASGDVTNITTSPESPLSIKTHLIDKRRSMTYKAATLEKDRFRLDGSFSFADDVITNNEEVGWSSLFISSSDGSFLKNLLETDGNIDVLGSWVGASGSTVTLDTSKFVYGSASAKAVVIGTNAQIRNNQGGPGYAINNTKYYLLVAEVCGNTPHAVACFENASGGVSLSSGPAIVPTANFQIVYATISPAQFGAVTAIYPAIIMGAAPTNGQTFNADGFRIYEITAAEKTYIDGLSLSAAQAYISDKYPYHEAYPSMTFDFGSNHSSAGLTVTFDQVIGEYATDFDMTAYDAGGAVITTKSVTGNTDIIAVPIGQLYNYRKVSVTIKKWSKPFRRARVFEVDFGFVKQYTDDNLINLSLVEEMDLLTGKLPSAEFKFTIDNSDRLFNILNPTGFYKYLQQRQQVIGEIGLDVGGGNFEYIPLGNYLLQEWQSDEGSLTATFTARTNLDSMASFDFQNLTAFNQSLYDLALSLFVYCGITNYSLDPALKTITTNSLVEKTNFRDLLQMIAIAGGANIYVTRDGKITLKCNKTRRVRYIRDWISGGSNANQANHWIEVQATNTAGTNVALGKAVTTNIVIANGSVGLVTNGDTSAAAGTYLGADTSLINNWVQVDLGSAMDIETVKVWHYYADGRIYNGTKTEISTDGVTWKTVFDSSISGTYAETAAGRTYAMETVLGDMTPVDSADFDNMYNEPQIALDKAIKRVEVTYWTDLSTSGVVGVDHPINKVGDTLKLEKNTLINTSARAQAVANWLMAQLAYRATYSVRWRGNPALELNDVLSMENTYGSTMSAYVTKNEIEYAGYLSVKTEAKGGVN